MGEMTTGDAIGLGLVGGIFNGGMKVGESAIWASAYRQIAETNAGAMQAINTQNTEMYKNIVDRQEQGATDRTRWQVMGLILSAYAGYNASLQQAKFADSADRRLRFNERLQLRNENRWLTTQLYATIHAIDTAANLEHQRMNQEFQLRMAEMQRPVQVTEEVVVNPDQWIIRQGV